MIRIGCDGTPACRVLSMLVPILVLAASAVPAAAERVSFNPIHRIARFFNPSLSKLENRLDWIEERLKTMPEYHEHPLRAGIGGRGHRARPDSPDPAVHLDLRAVHEIDRVFLIPAQLEFLGDPGIFPILFTLESATRSDFSDANLIFTTGGTPFPNPEGRPTPFVAGKTPARFLRLTVHAGHGNKGWIDLFGLSEIVVTAGSDVVSFGADVRIDGALDSGMIWHPGALVDGRMPCGIWQRGHIGGDRGDATIITEGDAVVCWKVRFDGDVPIDRVILFPYKLTRSFESSSVPNRLHIDAAVHEWDAWQRIAEWENYPLNSTCLTPLVINTNGITARAIRITATEPWQLGDLRIQGLSEIEVWSGGANIAAGRPVVRTREDLQEDVSSLTNGFTSEHMITDLPVWLDQLRERLRLENELLNLRPQVLAEAAESELIATMGAAVFMSLVLLSPVFYFEHRRSVVARWLEQMRRRIASDLHDDIGGNLGSISLIARAARKDLEKIQAPPEIDRDLEEVELIARESSLAMRDIVWLIEQRQDSVGDLIHRMREVAGRLLRGMEHSIACNSALTDSRLSPNCKRHLFLFFKEALHNIRKHSGATRVSVMVDDDRGRLVIEIQDDGIGMPQATADHPDTARKLRERAAMLDAGFTIRSREGAGTCVSLAIAARSLNTTPGIP